jgi:hypothetical protein
VFFGNESASMTRDRCEEFFDGDNFLSNDVEDGRDANR